MKEDLEFELSQIPGLGPVRRAALAEAGVQDLETLLALKVAELAAIQGIGLWQARKIREYLRQQGLLVETEEGAALIIADEADAATVETAVEVLEAQDRVEEELEAQVEALTEAVELEREDETLAQEAALTLEEAEVLAQVDVEEAPDAVTSGEEAEAKPTEAKPAEVSAAESMPTDTVPETEEAFGTAPDAEAQALASKIGEQREQLPEITLTLMESIRQAAVLPQLTRQITRLLITSGELVSTSKPLSPKTLEAASETLARAEQAVQLAVEKRTFSQTAQKELARRIRRRRKELEALLEEK